MAKPTFAYRLVGGNYPIIVMIEDGKETKIATVRWIHNRERTIAKAEEVVNLLNDVADE
jgi:hypothetical protein